MNTSLLYPRVTATRRVVSLDGMWKFQFDPKQEGVAAGWTAGLPDACSMPVPSSFCDIFTDKDSREYTGDFWYETDFLVPGEWKGRDPQGPGVPQRRGNLQPCGRLPAL